MPSRQNNAQSASEVLASFTRKCGARTGKIDYYASHPYNQFPAVILLPQPSSLKEVVIDDEIPRVAPVLSSDPTMMRY